VAKRYVRRVLALSKPPYLRWLAAFALIAGAFVWDVSKRATELAPFASTDIERGRSIVEADIEWKATPTGLFDTFVPEGAIAAVDIRRGDPITGSSVSIGTAVPVGWWTVPVDMPAAVVAGDKVRVLFAEGVGVDGIVVENAREDAFGILTQGLVAVSGDVADAVATAAASGTLIVLFQR
jgi:hypothetical protein